MGWVEPHGKGFRGRVQFAGQRLSTEVAPTRKRARTLLRELEQALTDPDWQDPRAGDVLFGEWVEEWRKTRGGVAAVSSEADEGRLRNHLLPAFKDVLLSELDALVVRQWTSGLNARLAPQTVRHCHSLLHHILELAVATGRLRKNPCEGTPLPMVQPKDQVILEPADLDVFVDCFGHEGARAFVETLAGTGLRWSEAVGLRVRRVTLERRRLSVREVLTAPGGRLQFKEMTKRRASYRTLALNQTVADALRPLLVGRDPDDLVFTSTDCASSCRYCRAARAEATSAGLKAKAIADRIRLVHAFRYSTFRRTHWDPALVKASTRGMTLKPTPHDLRHTHVSMLIDDNVPLPDIQRRLGHASIAITSDVYGHLLRHSDARIITALDKRMPKRRGPTLDDALAEMLESQSPQGPGGSGGGAT